MKLDEIIQRKCVEKGKKKSKDKTLTLTLTFTYFAGKGEPMYNRGQT